MADFSIVNLREVEDSAAKSGMPAEMAGFPKREGRRRMKLDDELIGVRQWDAVRVSAGDDAGLRGRRARTGATRVWRADRRGAGVEMAPGWWGD
jgi:hypothetical protein